MKFTGTSLWQNPNTAATNESGFTGLPAGYRFLGAFNGIGLGGIWWSSSELDTSGAWYRSLIYNDGVARRGNYPNNKWFGFSVRCLRD
jgi:uncharacterized protein (TIGR02145 family)